MSWFWRNLARPQRFHYVLVGCICLLLAFMMLTWHKQISSFGEDNNAERSELSEQKSGMIKAPVKHLEKRSGLTAVGKQFTLNGKPITIISGAIHYFRFPEEYWRDRLIKMKACGLNAIETYMPWNLHEPKPGVFDFSGDLDVAKFLQLANELDFLVFLRPGPYICSEWEFGGLPSWLLRDPGMKVRTMYPAYIDAVAKYFDKLMPLLRPLQYKSGGPIVAFQIDNEYGSYFQDKEYLPFLKQLMEKHGINELFFTSDNAGGLKSHNVDIPGVLKTINLKRVENRLNELAELQPNKPLMVMEFWTGWFDLWGDLNHHASPPQRFGETLNEILGAGASVNFYMFYGGTNFGFMNGGALDEATDIQKSDTTSYDYDAPLAENGDVTPKYYKAKSIIAHYFPSNLQHGTKYSFTDTFPRTAYSNIAVTQRMSLWSSLSPAQKVTVDIPVSMEMLDINDGAGQSYGYTLYNAEIEIAESKKVSIAGLQNVNDRGYLFVDLTKTTVITGATKNNPVEIEGKRGQSKVRIDVLVENSGRCNWKVFNNQRKGLIGPLTAYGSTITQWSIYPLEMKPDFITHLSQGGKWESFSCPAVLTVPSFFKFKFTIDDAPMDTYLDMTDWGKGVAFVNGKNLGRYWSVGPQQTLYLPAPWLKNGDNVIILFEEEKCSISVKFSSKPKLG